MQSVFRYPGGKSKKSIQNKILRYAPTYFKEYREPFVGGGGIFFAMDGVNYRIPEIRWINDINPDLIAVYTALQSDPTFIERCRAIRPAQPGEPEVHPKEGSTGQKYNARLKAEFHRLIRDRDRDPALAYLFVNRTVWAGRVNYTQDSRLYFSNPKGWNIVSTDRLQNAAELLKNVIISCNSYLPVITAEGEDVWIYLDPPYIKDTVLSSTSKLYMDSFTMDQHKELCEHLKRCPHKFCLSYDDDPDGIVQSLYAGFTIRSTDWIYCGTSSAPGAQKTKKKGKELIITNY